MALDAFVTMPNHFHGIVMMNLVGAQFIASHDPVDCDVSAPRNRSWFARRCNFIQRRKCRGVGRALEVTAGTTLGT